MQLSTSPPRGVQDVDFDYLGQVLEKNVLGFDAE